MNSCTCVSFAFVIFIFLLGVHCIIAITPGSMSGMSPSICVLSILLAMRFVCVSLTMISVAVISLITKGLISKP